MSGKYTVTTLNVKGLRQPNKRKCIFHYLKTKQTDICLLQEVHIDMNEDKLWEQELNQGCFCANVGTRASAGTLILTKIKMTVTKNIVHEPGRLQEVMLQHNDTTLRIFNIYGYNKEQLRIPLLQKLEKALKTVQHCDVLLIGGDFNVVLSNEMDKLGGQNRKTKSQIHINRMISDHKLVDVWRKENPTLKYYTWSQNQPKVRCRLDYFLVPLEFTKHTRSTKINASIKTDHKCVDLKIEIDKFVRGPGLWKINNSILCEEPYREQIKQLINSVWTDKSITNIATRFDYLKYKIRQTTKQYCKTKSQNQKLKERELLHNIER